LNVSQIEGTLMENKNLVKWDDRYSVGIQLIDDQHKELLRLINTFYSGCMDADENIKFNFTSAAHGLTNYINYHFAAEEQFLERIKYPDIIAHSRQHKEFIRDILEKIEKYERGKIFLLKNFARYIRDWLLTHMALIDKKYATYIHFVNNHVNGRLVYEIPAIRNLEAFRLEPEDVPSEIFLG
jgi:hemerythrin